MRLSTGLGCWPNSLGLVSSSRSSARDFRRNPGMSVIKCWNVLPLEKVGKQTPESETMLRLVDRKAGQLVAQHCEVIADRGFDLFARPIVAGHAQPLTSSRNSDADGTCVVELIVAPISLVLRARLQRRPQFERVAESVP